MRGQTTWRAAVDRSLFALVVDRLRRERKQIFSPSGCGALAGGLPTVRLHTGGLATTTTTAPTPKLPFTVHSDEAIGRKHLGSFGPAAQCSAADPTERPNSRTRRCS